jgi:hypothetical protein
MHPMLISALADQIVRERSCSCVNGLSRSFASRVLARGPRPERRGGFRLAPHPLIPRRAS